MPEALAGCLRDSEIHPTPNSSPICGSGYICAHTKTESQEATTNDVKRESTIEGIRDRPWSHDTRGRTRRRKWGSWSKGRERLVSDEGRPGTGGMREGRRLETNDTQPNEQTPNRQREVRQRLLPPQNRTVNANHSTRFKCHESLADWEENK